jgi:hypothetical protein
LSLQNHCLTTVISTGQRGYPFFAASFRLDVPTEVIKVLSYEHESQMDRVYHSLGNGQSDEALGRIESLRSGWRCSHSFTIFVPQRGNIIYADEKFSTR